MTIIATRNDGPAKSVHMCGGTIKFLVTVNKLILSIQ